MKTSTAVPEMLAVPAIQTPVQLDVQVSEVEDCVSAPPDAPVQAAALTRQPPPRREQPQLLEQADQHDQVDEPQA